MASQEIGLAELKRLLSGHLVLICSLAVLAGGLTWIVANWFTPVEYRASAKLVEIQGGLGPASRPTQVLDQLANSQAVKSRTVDTLIADGVLESGAAPFSGVGMQSRVEALGRGNQESTLIELIVVHESAETAAAVANAWARSFIEQCRVQLGENADMMVSVLREEIATIRTQLGELEEERAKSLQSFQGQEEDVSTRFDRQIAESHAESHRAQAEYHSETRQLMETLIREHSGANEGGLDRRFLELMTLRSELAKTPRLLTLENSLTEEDLDKLQILDESLFEVQDLRFSQEPDHLYEGLAMSALKIENDLKSSVSEARLPVTMELLDNLEKLQGQRLAGLTRILAIDRMESNALRRQRSQALRSLAREKNRVLAELARKVEQFSELENRLAKQLNGALALDAVHRVDNFELVGPAVAASKPRSRQVPFKVASASLLGAFLGLMIALFRAGSLPEPDVRAEQ